jgi:hypothetical protein
MFILFKSVYLECEEHEALYKTLVKFGEFVDTDCHN